MNLLELLKHPTSPAALAMIAVFVGGLVRILKSKPVSSLLDAIPVSWINRIPKGWLPWLAVLLGMVITLLDARLNAGMSWTDALYAGLAGVLAGSTAVAGHETVAKVIGFFIYKPNGPLDPPSSPTDKAPPADKDASVPPTSNRLAFLRRPLMLAATFVLACSLCLTGCAAIAAVLPDVIAAVLDGMQIIDVIEQFVARYFQSHPDPVAQKKVDDAILKARTALNVALRSAQGAKNLDDAQIDKAFEDFKQAYLELMALVRPYGVTPASSPAVMKATLSASGDTLTVPQPTAFKRGAR